MGERQDTGRIDGEHRHVTAILRPAHIHPHPCCAPLTHRDCYP